MPDPTPPFDAADTARGAPKATPNPHVSAEVLEAAHAAAIATWHVMATTGHREAVEAAVRAAAPILLAVGRTAAAADIRNAGGAYPDIRRQCANLAEHGTVNEAKESTDAG